MFATTLDGGGGDDIGDGEDFDIGKDDFGGDNGDGDGDLYIIGAVCLSVCNEKVTKFF